MHPGESIPNVGRRARGHGASTFTLKGNRVSKTTATTSAINPQPCPQPAENHNANGYNDDDNTKNDDVRGKCMESDRVGGNDDDNKGDSLSVYYHHSHHHPYIRIPHRIARSRQVRKEDHPHNPKDVYRYDEHLQSSPRITTKTSRDSTNPKDLYQQDNPAQISPRATIRTSRRLSHAHPNRAPPNRAPPTNQQTQRTHEQQFRWQGSRVVRKVQRLEKQSQQFLLRQQSSGKRSNVDLSGGCLTGRNLAGNNDSEGEDAVSEMPDTTRSDPGDMFRMNREKTKLPHMVRTSTEPLDDILDYFWVYQGMGRQVLNLDLPREVWEKKLFQKGTKLPPIPTPRDRTSMTHKDKVGHLKPGQEGRHYEKTSTARRAISEPPSLNSPRVPLSEVSAGMIEKRLGRSEVGANSTGEVLDPRTSSISPRTKGVGSTHSKRTLVVKMPVITRDPTRPDLLDND